MLPALEPDGFSRFRYDKVLEPLSKGSQSARSGMSAFTKRANERVTEFMLSVKPEWDAQPRRARSTLKRGMKVGSDADDLFLAQSKEAVTASLHAIYGLLGGHQVEPTQMVRDEECRDVLGASTSRYYHVKLPQRICRVVVTVTVDSSSGGSVGVFGALDVERPHSKSAPMRGKEVDPDPLHPGERIQVKYDHMYGPGDVPIELSDTLDRGKAVPPVSFLCVGIEAIGGQVTYTVKYSIEPLRVKLTREEMSRRLRQVYRGWEAKLDDIKRDPDRRAEFEAMTAELQSKRREKMKQICAHELSKMWTPRALYEQLQNRATENERKRREAYARKEQHDQEQYERAFQHATRREARAEQRRLEEEAQEAAALRQQRAMQWMTALVWAARMSGKIDLVTSARDLRRRLVEETQAATLIQRRWKAIQGAKRRYRLYRNVIVMRRTMLCHARVAQLAERQTAAGLLITFLRRCRHETVERGPVDIARNFRHKVVVLQRKWRAVRAMRQARLEVLLGVFKQALDKDKDVEEEKAEPDKAAAKGDKGEKAASAPKKKPIVGTAVRVVLAELSAHMHAVYLKEMAEWKVNRDVQSFTTVIVAKPRLFSVDETQVRNLIPMVRDVGFIISKRGTETTPWNDGLERKELIGNAGYTVPEDLEIARGQVPQPKEVPEHMMRRRTLRPSIAPVPPPPPLHPKRTTSKRKDSTRRSTVGKVGHEMVVPGRDTPDEEARSRASSRSSVSRPPTQQSTRPPTQQSSRPPTQQSSRPPTRVSSRPPTAG
mmetsp:Transcript_91205/g.244218  ORF Transcript_91205/g.244218 Transcript_91205/m.244218 type:complete len:773 (-) Transcript_91205:131-2449(-)